MGFTGYFLIFMSFSFFLSTVHIISLDFFLYCWIFSLKFLWMNETLLLMYDVVNFLCTPLACLMFSFSRVNTVAYQQ